MKKAMNELGKLGAIGEKFYTILRALQGGIEHRMKKREYPTREDEELVILLVELRNCALSLTKRHLFA